VQVGVLVLVVVADTLDVVGEVTEQEALIFASLFR
jgi:hypothetical protein